MQKQVAEKVTRRQVVWVAVCWAAALSVVACGESKSDDIYVGESVTLAHSENSRLYVEDASDQGVLVQAIDPGAAGTCGNLVFVSLDGKVSSLAADVFSAVLSPAGRAILSADGDKAAYLANENCGAPPMLSLKVVDISTGMSETVWDSSVSVLAWTESNELVFYVRDQEEITTWIVDSQGVVTEMAPAGDISLNGTTIALGDPERAQLLVTDRTSGETIQFDGMPLDPGRSYLSPDGEHYLYLSTSNNENDLPQLASINISSEVVREFPEFGEISETGVSFPITVQWSPDGTAVLLQETVEETAPAYLLTSDEQVHSLGEVLGRSTIWRGSLAYSQSENEIFVTVLETRPTPTGELDDIARTLRDTFREPALLRFEAVD